MSEIDAIRQKYRYAGTMQNRIVAVGYQSDGVQAIADGRHLAREIQADVKTLLDEIDRLTAERDEHSTQRDANLNAWADQAIRDKAVVVDLIQENQRLTDKVKRHQEIINWAKAALTMPDVKAANRLTAIADAAQAVMNHFTFEDEDRAQGRVNFQPEATRSIALARDLWRLHSRLTGEPYWGTPGEMKDTLGEGD